MRNAIGATDGRLRPGEGGIAQFLVKNQPARRRCKRGMLNPLEDPGEENGLPTPAFLFWEFLTEKPVGFSFKGGLIEY